MAEPPDLQDLAKRYLDLWQDQLRAMAADPDMMASVGRMLAAAAGQQGQQPAGGAPATPNPFAWWLMPGAMPPMSPTGGATPFDTVFAASRTHAEARSEAAAASPDGCGDELRQLERRLAALEKRLAAMEPGARQGRGSTPRKPRKSKR